MAGGGLADPPRSPGGRGVDSADRFPDRQRLLSRLSARAAHDLNNLISIASGHVYLMRQPGAEIGGEPRKRSRPLRSQLERLARNLGRLGNDRRRRRTGRSRSTPWCERAAARAEGRRLRLDLGGAASRGPRCRERPGRGAGLPDRERPPKLGTPRTGGPCLDPAGSGGRGRRLFRSRTPALGIPPEIAERIFDPFFSTKPGRGAGLGLFLVAVVAAAHGTSCRIEPRSDGGTEARLRLPVRPRE